MCGFTGVISTNELNPKVILDSIASIKHRGPDDTLIFTEKKEFFSCELSSPASKESFQQLTSDKKSTAFFAFNRLSIVDLSAHAMQPFFDQEKEIVFMLNGEVYNYVRLKKEFLANETLISQSDSEVAYMLYLKFGDEFVQHMRGMFSIVVYDLKNNILKAWRDRLGMKPFYYANIDGVFIFSSEMKGIFATNFIKKETNYQGLAYSMYLGTCPSPLTIYKYISSLEAGCKLEYSHLSGQIKIDRYWHLKYTPAKRTIGFDEFNADMMELCQLHRTGDVEKALMLSGGMDSGTLAYYFSKFDPKLKCLNIFANGHRIDEREFAKENASNAGLDIIYLEIPSSPSASLIESYIQAEEEPNSIPEPAVFLCEEARKMGIEVLYSALGPDEIFGGYKYFATIHKLKKLSGLLKLTPNFLIPKKHREKFSEVKKYGFDYYPIICRRLFTWDQIKKILKLEGEQKPIHPIQYLKNQINVIYPDYNNLPLLKKVSYLEIYYFITSHHTFRSDQPSMRFSIEMRFPFLDHQFIEKYFNQPDTFENIGKYLKPQFREYVSNVLSSRIFEMEKKGFSMPTENWTNISLTNFPGEFQTTNSSQFWYLTMLNKIKKEV
ncbi:MAG: asparagine synthase (glutamine-hydrolyzing) [Bacteroidota bacterium]|nr:asparagine synthase (glutamine-hydrolyzing) [Bacteroidota bacterium]